MTVDVMEGVMRRIEGANPSSPIAVFTCRSCNKLNAVPAKTVETQKLIRRQDPTLVGVFDNSMPRGPIRERLSKALNRFRQQVA